MSSMPTPLQLFISKHRRFIGIGAFLLSATIALMYVFVVPEQAQQSSGLVKGVLLYGHSLCWAFIAIATILWVYAPASRWGKRFAYLGLAVYVTFMLTLVFSSF